MFYLWRLFAFAAVSLEAGAAFDGSTGDTIRRKLYSDPDGAFLRLNLFLGGGYDSNLFRAPYPLLDDFDYPSFQPEGKTQAKTIDAAPQVTAGYFFPEGGFWRRMMLAASGGGEIHTLKTDDSESGAEAENFRRWNLGGEWFVHMGDSNDEGIFARVRYTFTRTKHQDAWSVLSDQPGGLPRYNYEYDEHEIRYGIGLASRVMPPIGFEAVSRKKDSPWVDSSGENYDYGPGKISARLISGMIAGSIRSAGSVEGDADVNEFNRYRSMLEVSGLILTVCGDYFSRIYTTLYALDRNGLSPAGSPLLEEKRLSVKADLYMGIMLVKPIVEVKQMKGIRLGYEYLKNEDNYEGYYDYVLHKGIGEVNYRRGPVVFAAAYEYRVKTFKERDVPLSTDKRRDRFHTVTAGMDLLFSKMLRARIDYSFTKGESNEDLVYINYDKHLVYGSASLMYETGF